MTSTELKHQAKLQEWSARIQDCRSGLSVRAWCRQKEIYCAFTPQMEISHLRAPYMGQPLANHGKTTIVVLDAVHSGLTILR